MLRPRASDPHPTVWGRRRRGKGRARAYDAQRRASTVEEAAGAAVVAVDRSRLGHAGGPDDGASGLVRCWDRLDRAETGSLTVFKGTAWPGAADRAVVHRSPPKDGQRRVLLTLDWLD